MRSIVHVYDSIISIENLLSAWEEFKRGKQYRSDVLKFEEHLFQNVHELHTSLRDRTYLHGPYEHFVVNDPKRRDIHKATVQDRLLHHAIHRVLYPYFDTRFIHDSYSCRIGKGTHRAMNRFRDFYLIVSKNRTRTCFVLKCDIKKFFASIDHVVLLRILTEHLLDTDTLWLLERIIKSFHSAVEEKGLPLGNLTSQLLVNVYMNEFDQYVKHVLGARYYIRYADDFVFLSTGKNELDLVRQKCKAFLTERLALTLHPGKVFIKTLASGVDFLGWVHFPDHRVLRTTTKRRMLRRVNNSNITSYLGLLSHGNTWKLAQHVCDSV